MADFVRPNGRPYRSRKPGLRAHAWDNEGVYDDEGCGVIVFGTLDPDEARPLAESSAVHWFGAGTVDQPTPGWWRDGFKLGERSWRRDDEKGAPGVMFTWEPTYADANAQRGDFDEW